MNRNLFKQSFLPPNVPSWPCPSCEKGILELIEDSFRKEERTASRKMREGEEYWEYEWIQYTYICLLRCANKHCKEIVTLCGEGGVETNNGPDPDGIEEGYSDYFHPRFFLPHLRLIQVPEGTSPEVLTELNKSFELFFCDAPSASNHLRVALECLLTSLKIKRFISRNNKRHYLTLHDRIEMIPAKQATIKDMCFAVKWLGNAGSHSDKQITRDDVMDAYEIIEVLLRELYDNAGKIAKKLAKQINFKKGPIR